MTVKSQIDGVERFLRLEPRSRVLDLGCGTGRRTIELARRGHRVLGLDPDESALFEARAAANGEKLNIHFLKADTRAIPYRGEIDAVVCLDGAFGRLSTDRDDLKCLESVRKALKPSGLLLLDTLNREWLMRHFESNVWEQGEGAGVAGAVVRDQISFDFERGRLENRRLFDAERKRTPSFLSVRVYALTEIKAQIERAGLVYRQSWGGLDGSVYGMDSARAVVLAERPYDDRTITRGSAASTRRRREIHEDAADLQTAIRIKGRRRR